MPPGPLHEVDAGREADATVKPPDPIDPIDPPDDPPAPTTGAVAVLDIHAMDAWAQYLPADATLTVMRGKDVVATKGFPIARLELGAAADYTVRLTAEFHDPVEVHVHYDGGARLDAARVTSSTAGDHAGLVLAHEMEGKLAVHRLVIGLRHQYFAASGRPARRGNKLQLLMDGEEAWSQVKRDLEAARSTIHVTTWWFESNFELVRATPLASAATRQANTILSLLEHSPAMKRVLVNQFYSQDGILSDMTTDEPLRAHGSQAGDRFEYMGQANLTDGMFRFALEPVSFVERVRGAVPALAGATVDPAQALDAEVPPHEVDLTHWPVSVDVTHATWHQKFITLDGKVAFVGGMNLTEHDWDSSAHRVFDPRRMPYDASTADRDKVAAHGALPHTPPAKDYMMRVEGPGAQDVEDAFKLRWDLAVDEGVEHAGDASRFSVTRTMAPAGNVQAQITTTMPDPLWEHSIAESWLNAVAHAEKFIYIEDQYFRAPLLFDAIARRMREVPGLRLVVITRPVGEWTDVGCVWTARSAERFADEFPSRFKLLQLRAFDTAVTWGWDETEARWVDVYTHAKMLIVDDVFLSVGSANKNNRGMIYEGEMNVAVVDRDFVRAARRRVFANLLPGLAATDDLAVWWAQLGQAADWNDYVQKNWEDEGGDLDLDGDPLPEKYTPFGMIHSLGVPRVDQCLLEDIGPDVT